MDPKDETQSTNATELEIVIDEDKNDNTSDESEPDEKKSDKQDSESSKKSKSSSPKDDVAKKRKLIMIISSALVAAIVIGGLAAAFLSGQPSSEPTPTPSPSTEPSPTPIPATKASRLDGVVVANELAERHPLAIMVENSTLARPQAGLGDASVVYEAIVEGGITRFMSLFSHTLPAKVGPVRSSREVFVDFAEEYTPSSAYYAHVGGSPESLDKIAGDKVYDLNQFSIGAKAFQRFPKAGVATEHTMYTFPEKLYDVAKSLNYRTESDFRAWKFKDDANALSRPEAQTITIPFSSVAYEVKYVYDKATNKYKRFMAGSEHKDANTGTQIAVKNIAVMFAHYVTADAKGRQDVKVIGSGDAKIFLDGKMIEAKWQKSSSPGRTIFTDAATGNEIEFNAGSIWIEVPKTGTTVTVQ